MVCSAPSSCEDRAQASPPCTWLSSSENASGEGLGFSKPPELRLAGCRAPWELYALTDTWASLYGARWGPVWGSTQVILLLSL